MQEKASYVIIGNGIAGVTAAEILRAEDSAAFGAIAERFRRAGDPARAAALGREPCPYEPLRVRAIGGGWAGICGSRLKVHAVLSFWGKVGD